MENHQRPQLNASRRMPMFKLSKTEATDITNFLLNRSSEASVKNKKRNNNKLKDSKANEDDAKKEPAVQQQKKIAAGKKLFIETGCLACHPSEGIGKATLFGGTDLTGIANKRKANFFEKWLKTPEKINKNHRMPQFNLNGKQIAELSSYLKTLRVKSDEEQYAIDPSNRESVARGETLLAKLNCNRCHSPEDKQRPLKTKENAEPCFSSIARKHENRFQPQYIVSESDELAIETYLTENANRQNTRSKADKPRAIDLLAQNNCFACHSRDTKLGNEKTLSDLAQKLPDYASQLSKLKPPSLNSVGDKLHKQAWHTQLTGTIGKYRDYLAVQMPKYRLSESQTDSIREYFQSLDTIPSKATNATNRSTKTFAANIGHRLVSSSGFSCSSCHQIGSSKPAKAPVNARGPNLSNIEKRIRYEWFVRWCKDPVRIVPKMEMPSVKIPVAGVLDENVDTQLLAVWKAINDPNFKPAKPDPVRAAYLSGSIDADKQNIVLTDVFKTPTQTFVKPFVVGLGNRHNILFDLETASIAKWWVEDTALQINNGKRWHWEFGGPVIQTFDQKKAEFVVYDFEKKRIYAPKLVGQSKSRLLGWKNSTINTLAVELIVQIEFESEAALNEPIRLRQTFSANHKTNGFTREFKVFGLPNRMLFGILKPILQPDNKCDFRSPIDTANRPQEKFDERYFWIEKNRSQSNRSRTHCKYQLHFDNHSNVASRRSIDR